MLKAVFMDYYGTAAQELGPIAMEVVDRVYKSSQASSHRQVLEHWWKTYRCALETAVGDRFRCQHEVALESFQMLQKEFQSTEDPEEMLERMEEHWCTAAAYEDVQGFLHEVGLPVYFVTNSDDLYVKESIQENHLQLAGVITSEQARYAKPHKELFQYALDRTGLKPQEVVHIGDSLSGDVECPAQVGIRSIWLNREDKEVPEGVTWAKDLRQALEIVKEMRQQG